MPVQPRTRTALAWLLFGASFACLAAGLVIALAVVRPLPLAAKIHLAVGEPLWAPAIALGVTLPLLLFPDGRLRSPRCGAVSSRPWTAASTAAATTPPRRSPPSASASATSSTSTPSRPSCWRWSTGSGEG
jgi:hypothetical protein